MHNSYNSKMKYYSIQNLFLVAIHDEYDYIATLSSGYLNSSSLQHNTLLRKIAEIEGQQINSSQFESLINLPTSVESATELTTYYKVIKENGKNS